MIGGFKHILTFCVWMSRERRRSSEPPIQGGSLPAISGVITCYNYININYISTMDIPVEAISCWFFRGPLDHFRQCRRARVFFNNSHRPVCPKATESRFTWRFGKVNTHPTVTQGFWRFGPKKSLHFLGCGFGIRSYMGGQRWRVQYFQRASGSGSTGFKLGHPQGSFAELLLFE